ncbi:MAG TPA: hypothetical protein VJ917_02310 [Saprospiraceae bacterium]|nr:hypothetical protein [Saprospiraceae bacterium]
MTSQQIWQVLKPHFRTKSHAVYEISELLHLSQPAVYNRMSGKTPFTLEELELLAKHWNLHFLIRPEGDQSIFACRYGVLNGQNRKPIEYLKDVAEYLNRASSKSDVHMTLIMQELPPFLLFSYPYLSAFKFYHWGNSTWMSRGLSDTYRFSQLLNNNSIHEQTRFITEFTRRHSICEFYQGNIIQKTLTELAYYLPILQKEKAFDLNLLLEELKSAVQELEMRSAEGSVGHQVFLVNVKTLSESFLLESKEESIAFVSFDEPHYLEMRDVAFVNHFRHMLKIMKDNAMCISGMNRLERKKYFDQLIFDIAEFRSRFL